VTVSSQGFSTAVVNDIAVNVGQRERVNVTLQPGNVADQVEVTDATPLLQTESANIGTTVGARQLNELPTGGRNIYGFLYLSSTVNRAPSGNAEGFRVESQGSLSISGTRASSITFKIDGLANTDPTFGTPTITPSLDAVQEFQLQNNAYSAEFEGITQVNIATKSGGRHFHGSIFDFVQNDALQPRNPLNPPDKTGKPGKNRLRFNNFGASVGGPIWLPRFGEGGPAFFDKDRTFFFFSYEGRRQNQLATGAATVLTQAQRAGDFSSALGGCVTVSGTPVPLLNPNGTPSGGCVRVGQIFDPATTVSNPLFNPNQPASAFNPEFIRQPFANNQIPSSRINPTATALLNAQMPLPNIASTTGEANFLGTSGVIFDLDQYSVRVDHKFSEKNNLYARLALQDNFRIGKSQLRYTNKATQGQGRVFSSTWTRVLSPAAVNEFRLGYVRGVYGDSIEEIDPTQFGIQNTLINLIPLLQLTPAGGGALNFGGFSGSILQTVQNTYQFSDNFSLTRGRHSIRFGAKVDHNRFQKADYFNSNGRATFSGLFSTANSSVVSSANRNNGTADFLLGLANSNSLNVTRPANIRNTPWAAYVQDDWRFSPRVTMNLGLRYELHQPYREQLLGGARVDLENGGRVIVADPQLAANSASALVVCCTDPRVVDTDKNDFGPRVGVAIQPFKDDPTVIRAGYGLFYSDMSQNFHWDQYVPRIGSSFQPALTSFQGPAISLSDLFPTSQFTPPAGRITVGTPAGVNPAAIGNQPIITGGSYLGSYKTPLAHQWSVSLQRELIRNLLVDLNYTGNVSRNLPIQWIFSQPTPSPVAANLQSTDPAANPYLRRPYANFAIGAYAMANILSSSYNAGTLKVERRFAQGYSFLSSYTWSKSLDEGSESFSLAAGNFSILSDNHDLKQNRGPAASDIPHRWVTSGIVELPLGRGKPFLSGSGWTDKVFGGWQFSGVFTLQSGMPFTPYIRNRNTNTGSSLFPERGTLVGDPYFSDEEWNRRVSLWQSGVGRLQLINPASVAGNPLSGTDYPRGTYGTLSRNFFRTPYGRALDLSVAKGIRLGEVTRFDLRADILNVTNERLHRVDLVNSVFADQALTNSLMGSIAEYVFFFNPRVIQIGLRFSF
jgi:hypothetical protein